MILCCGGCKLFYGEAVRSHVHSPLKLALNDPYKSCALHSVFWYLPESTTVALKKCYVAILYRAWLGCQVRLRGHSTCQGRSIPRRRAEVCPAAGQESQFQQVLSL